MSRKEIDRIRKELDRQGFDVRMGGKGHWKIYSSSGRMVTVLPATPSDHRSVANAVAQLRRAGFIWPPR